MAKYELENMNMNNLITIRDIYNKKKDTAYLKIGVQELEGYVHGLENHNQEQQIDFRMLMIDCDNRK
jgi:hypothetical protein